MTLTLLAITMFFPVLLGCSTEGLRAHSAGCWLSLPHLLTNWSVSKLTDFLSSLSYIIVPHSPSFVGITIALIQPIHGQGYNSDIPRPDAPVIYIGAFPILTAWPGHRLIYNIYMYTYIYCHPQTVSFVVSQLFCVVIHVGRLKLRSKPAQLYIRLSIIELSQQVNHISSGIIRHFVVSFIFWHFCLSRYQHHASGSCKFLRQNAQPLWGSIYIVIHRPTILVDHNSSV